MFYSDGRIFDIKYEELDFSLNVLKFNMDGIWINVDLPKATTGLVEEATCSMEEEATYSIEKEATCSMENIDKENEDLTRSFPWNDASTKLFLEIYKCKKDLVSTRKIKTYKILWKYIAEEMKQNGYSVSPLQVENKFKSLVRSYKNMISNNKKTGRGRTTCSFET